MKNSIHYVGLLFVVFVSQFVLHPDYNEVDVVPQGYALFSDWLANDWYLSQVIVYRIPIGYLIGALVSVIGFDGAIIIGRFVSYGLFVFAFHGLIRTLNIRYEVGATVLIVFFTFFSVGMNYGEWMVGGLETKVFSYISVLLSVKYFLSDRWKNGFFYVGLALSLHLLVGGYHLFCLLLVLSVLMTTRQGIVNRVRLALPWFFIGGAWGMYGLISYLLTYDDPEVSEMGWNIYTNLRVSFHTLPKISFNELAIPIVFTTINVIALFWSKNDQIKALGLYSLATVIIVLVGFGIFIYGDSSYLRYYFFRFNDVIQPLITLLMVGSLVQEKTEDYIKCRYSVSFIYPVMLALSLIPFVITKYDHLSQMINIGSYGEKWSGSSIAAELTNWIKSNTSNTAEFIIPIELTNFYLKAERAVFVSWKHSPQDALNLVEWNRRIGMINRGVPLELFHSDPQKEVQMNYDRLSSLEVLEIKKEYPSVTHVIMAIENDLDLPKVFQNEQFCIYVLK